MFSVSPRTWPPSSSLAHSIPANCPHPARSAALKLVCGAFAVIVHRFGWPCEGFPVGNRIEVSDALKPRWRFAHGTDIYTAAFADQKIGRPAAKPITLDEPPILGFKTNETLCISDCQSAMFAAEAALAGAHLYIRRCRTQLQGRSEIPAMTARAMFAHTGATLSAAAGGLARGPIRAGGSCHAYRAPACPCRDRAPFSRCRGH